MQGKVLALKPYVEQIQALCQSLSREELVDLLVRLGVDSPVADRKRFLDQIEAALPGRRSRRTSRTKKEMKNLLDEVQGLRKSMEERRESIEDGTFWDDEDSWEWDSYDETPDLVGEDQAAVLESLFSSAGELLLGGEFHGARELYSALFELILDLDEDVFLSPLLELDSREERARYARSVYESLSEDKRVEAFLAAMQPDMVNRWDKDDPGREYPMLRDVMDALPQPMHGLEAFLPVWYGALNTENPTGRNATLRLEATHLMEGVSGVARLAREWKGKQPRGYLYWLRLLEEAGDCKEVISVAQEALDALEPDGFREQAARLMIEAAHRLEDDHHLLSGKREAFFSCSNDDNLLDLVTEATRQGKRKQELAGAIRFCETASPGRLEQGVYVKTLLLAGRLTDSLARVEDHHAVGWSGGTPVGLVFAAVLSACTGSTEEATSIQKLLRDHANRSFMYSGGFTVHDEGKRSCAEEIVSGLHAASDLERQAQAAFPWAEEIGRKRIERIVTHKHRNAYGRAAHVLGALAETFVAQGRRDAARDLYREYCHERFPRHRAFRSEVDGVVSRSPMLRTTIQTTAKRK